MARRATRRQRLQDGQSRASYWRSLSAEWSGSGLSQKAFCNAKGVPLGTFAWWRHHLKQTEHRASRDKAARAVEFVPVRLRAAGPMRATPVAAIPMERAPSASPVEIVMPGGVIVRVYAGCEEATLIGVLSALRGDRC